MAVFEDDSREILNEALALGQTRGAEYQDTWSIENQHPLFTSMTRNLTAGDPSRDADRLVRAASLVDTKISRIVCGGEFKRDSYVDLINYLALLAKRHEAYDRGTKTLNNIGQTSGQNTNPLSQLNGQGAGLRSVV